MSYLVGNPEDRFSHDGANTVICPKDADGMTNNEDPNQTTPFRDSLIWVCTACPDLPV